MSYFQGQGGQYTDDYVSQSPREQPPPFPQWEQQQQQQQHQQQDQHSQDPTSQQHTTLEHHHVSPQHASTPLSIPPPPLPVYHPLDDPTQLVVPSHVPGRGTHDPTPIRLIPAQRSPPVEIKPIMLQVDTTATTTARSTAAPSARPASRARAHQYHPYTRPSSAMGLRRDAEAQQHHHHHIRFASQASTPQTLSGSAMPSPVMTRQTFPSPPAVSDYGQQGPSSSSALFVAGSPQDAGGGGVFTPYVPAVPAVLPDDKRYIIRADTHYDSDRRMLVALLELPGVKRHDVRVCITTTLFNRVRQVTVHGHSRAPFPVTSTAAIRERKYGRFSRSFPVPPDTRADDIVAAMEDGVLTLKISCGLPAASADEHEIPIR